MDDRLIYIPKYVKQESDLAYSEKVTHENYNEKLNLNTTQGDYNTEVLDKLFNSLEGEDTYHVAYIDRDITDINEDLDGVHNAIDSLSGTTEELSQDIDTIETNIEKITQGTTTVGHATEADRISSGTTAGPSKYYGTNENSELGFIPLPDFLYAVPMESSTGVDGVYYIPALDSVAESMLTPEVRTKLNREAVTDYEYLDNKPSINSVTLVGAKSLSDLGIQPVGNYVTDAELTSTLTDYYTITDAQSWVNTQLSSYTPISSYNSLASRVQSVENSIVGMPSAIQARARISVNGYVSNPVNGDLAIFV